MMAIHLKVDSVPFNQSIVSLGELSEEDKSLHSA